MPGNSLALLTRQAQATGAPLPCQRESPQLWFSDLPDDLELAKAHCAPKADDKRQARQARRARL
jgi:hypothetical protein